MNELMQPPAAPANSQAPQDGFDLMQVLIPVWRGKWLILVVTALCTAAAIDRSYKKEPVYKAEAVLLPVEDNSDRDAGFAAQFGGLASIVGVNLGGASSNVTTSIAIFKSKKFAGEFIERRKLMPLLFDTTKAVDSSKPPPTLMDGAMLLSSNMDIVLKEGLVTLTVRWSDPELAAKWANNLVDYINTYLRLKAIAEAESSIEYLKNEINRTPVASMQEMLNRLIEKQIQVIALAKVRKQYAFSVIDYATPPKIRESPNRVKDAVTGVAVGIALSLFLLFGWVTVRNLRRSLAQSAR